MSRLAWRLITLMAYCKKLIGTSQNFTLPNINMVCQNESIPVLHLMNIYILRLVNPLKSQYFLNTNSRYKQLFDNCINQITLSWIPCKNRWEFFHGTSTIHRKMRKINGQWKITWNSIWSPKESVSAFFEQLMRENYMWNWQKRNFFNFFFNHFVITEHQIIIVFYVQRM